MQTSYTMSPALGFPGMISTAECTSARSFSAELAIPFGRGVIKGTKDTQAKVPGTNAGVFLGFSIHDNKMADSSGVVQYTAKETVSVLTKGPILVESTVAVAMGDPVYVIPGVIGTDANAGKVTNVATSNLATGAKFRATIASAGLVEIEINLP